MPVGTKVFLAIFALVIGVLIVYYGVFMPGEEKLRVTTADLDSNTTNAPAELPARDLLNSPGATTVPPSRDHAAASDTTEPDRISMGAMGDGTWSSFAPPAAMPEQTAPVTTPPQDLNGGAGRNPSGPVRDPLNQASGRDAANAAPVTTVFPARATTPPAPSTPQPSFTAYTVKQHDTLSGIALAWFGDARKWELILESNPTLDPKRLQIGQQIRLPARDAARAAAAPVTTRTQGLRTYVVRSGDSLSSIAGAVYGHTALWQRIYQANQRTIGVDPDRLVVGMQLIIPDSN